MLDCQRVVLAHAEDRDMLELLSLCGSDELLDFKKLIINQVVTSDNVIREHVLAENEVETFDDCTESFQLFVYGADFIVVYEVNQQRAAGRVVVNETIDMGDADGVCPEKDLSDPLNDFISGSEAVFELDIEHIVLQFDVGVAFGRSEEIFL